MGCGYGEPTTGREGDVMSEAFGSADAAEHWSLNSVVLRVKPEDMMRTAADLEAMANKIDDLGTDQVGRPDVPAHGR